MREALLYVRVGRKSSVPVMLQWKRALQERITMIEVVAGRTDMVLHLLDTDLPETILRTYTMPLGKTVKVRGRPLAPVAVRAVDPRPVVTLRMDPSLVSNRNGVEDPDADPSQYDAILQIDVPSILREGPRPFSAPIDPRDVHQGTYEYLLAAEKDEVFREVQDLAGDSQPPVTIMAAWDVPAKDVLVLRVRAPNRTIYANLLRAVNEHVLVAKTTTNTVLPAATDGISEPEDEDESPAEPLPEKLETVFFIRGGKAFGHGQCLSIKKSLSTHADHIEAHPLLGGTDALVFLAARRDIVAKTFWKWISEGISGKAGGGAGHGERPQVEPFDNVEMYIVSRLAIPSPAPRPRKLVNACYIVVELSVPGRQDRRDYASEFTTELCRRLPATSREVSVQTVYRVDKREWVLLQLAFSDLLHLFGALRDVVQASPLVRSTQTYISIPVAGAQKETSSRLPYEDDIRRAFCDESDRIVLDSMTYPDIERKVRESHKKFHGGSFSRAFKKLLPGLDRAQPISLAEDDKHWQFHFTSTAGKEKTVAVTKGPKQRLLPLE